MDEATVYYVVTRKNKHWPLFMIRIGVDFSTSLIKIELSFLSLPLLLFRTSASLQVMGNASITMK